MSIIYINPYRFAAAGPTDPDFANVSLLLHGDGTNGSTTIVDSSSSPKTVTAVGDAQISTAQSKFGGASLAFDGNGDYLTGPSNNADFNFGTGDFTIEAFAYPVENLRNGTIFCYRSNSNDGVIVIQNAGQWFAKVGGVSIAAGAVTLNSFSHIAAVRASGVLTLYVNGTSVGSNSSATYNLTGSASHVVRIGALSETPSSLQWKGYIDDLRITRGVARYVSNFTPPTAPFPDVGPTTDPYLANVSLLLHGDGTNGSTTVIDSSPSPQTVTAAGDAQISTAQSKFGGASIAFDGSGDYLQLSSQAALSFGTDDFTIETWARLTSTGNVQVIIEARNQLAPVPWILAVDSSNKILFRHGVGLLTSNASITYGQWQHYAVTRSAGVIRIFIDGVTDTSTATNTSAIDAGAQGLIGQAFGSGYYINGYIDDLRITKGVARYTSNFTPPTAPFPDA